MPERRAKVKLLKFQALDYTAALLVPSSGRRWWKSRLRRARWNAPTGTFKMLVRTSNSEDLADWVNGLVDGYGDLGDLDDEISVEDDAIFFRIFKVFPQKRRQAKRKLLALHESVRPALLEELKRFSRVRVTTDPSVKDIRYTLDYIVNSYWIGGHYDVERHTLQSRVHLW